MFRLRDADGKIPSAESNSSRREEIRPVAVCKGGAWNNKIVWLGPKDMEGSEDDPVFEGLAAPKDTQFMPLPETRNGMRDVVYVTGASGTGKTTFVRECLDNFITTFATCEKRGKDKTNQEYLPKIIIVCPENPERDPAFKDIPEYSWLTPGNLLKESISLDDLEDPNHTIVIFDDVEGLTDIKEVAALAKFSQMVLERGRKRHIYCYFISHTAANGRATKVILNEQNAIWFPSESSSQANLIYCLEKNMGIPGALFSAIKKNAKDFGRWIMIKTDSQPRYVITPQRLFSIDEDDIKTQAKIAKKIDSKLAIDQALIAAGVKPSHHKRLAAARVIKENKYLLPDNVFEESDGEADVGGASTASTASAAVPTVPRRDKPGRK